MNPIQRRFRRVIQRLGETYTTSGRTGFGVFTTVGPGLAGTFLTKAELDAHGRPLRFAYVPADDPTTLATNLTVNGLVLTVLKAIDLRHRGSTVARLLVLS